MENKFELVEEDYYALEIAKKIARHFLSLPIVKPKQIIGLGNAIFALERIPKSTPGVFVNYGVELCKGNNDFRERRYIDFMISEDRFEISTGGSSVDNQSGGDAYSEPGWIIETGGYYNRECMLSQIEDEIFEFLNLGAEINVEDESNLNFE